ncbi:hypothetical protein E0Z10_g10649, partial [Xylaria hypoxylon]
AQKEYELERAQQELEEMKLSSKIEHEEKRRERTAREERELRDAKKELDAIREKKDRDELENRIKQKINLDRLREEEAALAESKRREKEAKDAVERYKKGEAERALREREENEERDRQYKQRLQEQLLKSGLDEEKINAILAGKKIEKPKPKEEKPQKHPYQQLPHQQLPPIVYPEPAQRPTYTRMARRHLSLETLRVYDIDFVLDQDPEYILIKRWVPEQEQDILWRHTRTVREQRSGKLVLAIEDGKKHHHHLNPDSNGFARRSAEGAAADPLPS